MSLSSQRKIFTWWKEFICTLELKNFSTFLKFIWRKNKIYAKMTKYYLSRFLLNKVSLQNLNVLEPMIVFSEKPNIRKKYLRTNCSRVEFFIISMSGGQLLEIWLLDNHLLDTFGRKSIAWHKIYQLLESGWARINWIRAVSSSWHFF
jgi:hypothetical protein